jgi:flagellar M-ring protein FliF
VGKKTVQGILEQIRRFGAVRLAVMALVSLGLLSFFGYIIVRASQPSLAVLYSDLSPEDTTAIMRELDARGLTYEMRDDGRTILAPRPEIAKLRLDLASKGVPTGGAVGYEIFDRSDAFSSSGLVQTINQLRALEGELARSIRTIGAVQSARVHLAIPEKRLFERDRQPPRASIALKLRGDLSPAQISAIRRLVASAVEGLKPELVSIVDEQGRLLADGTSGDGASGVALEEKQATLERRLRTQIEDIIASVVGQGRARVQVSAELDPARVQTVSESFDPESKVVRSTQNRNENQTTTDVKDGTVSVANELPSGQSNNTNQRDASAKNEEVVNYEISKTTKTEVSEGGKVKRISVAVLVDGTYAKGANGDVTYTPRAQADLDRIAALVKSGIGFNTQRGDQIEVVNLRFASTPDGETATEASSSFSLSRFDLQRFGELGLLALLSLVIALFVARPLIKTMALPAPRSSAGEGDASGSFEGAPLDHVTALIGAQPQAASMTVKQWLQENNRT